MLDAQPLAPPLLVLIVHRTDSDTRLTARDHDGCGSHRAWRAPLSLSSLNRPPSRPRSDSVRPLSLVQPASGLTRLFSFTCARLAGLAVRCGAMGRCRASSPPSSFPLVRPFVVTEHSPEPHRLTLASALACSRPHDLRQNSKPGRRTRHLAHSRPSRTARLRARSRSRSSCSSTNRTRDRRARSASTSRASPELFSRRKKGGRLLTFVPIDDDSAASVEPNLNANLQLGLVAYGIHAINTTIQLCDILGGVLCPLPEYDFVGSATIPLPASLAGNIDIPGAAYWIPDLEATAYGACDEGPPFPRPTSVWANSASRRAVRLLRVADGSEAACLRVDLANGKTTRWASVSWALGGLAIGCVALSALWFLVGTLVYPAAPVPSTTSPADPNAAWASLGRRKERLFLLMSLLQFVATTGLLSIDYPIIYEAFTSNFAWSLGLIRETPIVNAIDDLRARTGGNLAQLAGRSGLVGGTEALKSIYSRSSVAFPSAGEIATSLLEELGHSLSPRPSPPSSLTRRALSLLASSTSTAHLGRRQFGNPMNGVPSTNPDQAVAVPDVQETNTLNAVQYGIPHFLVNLDISPFDGFMLVFINFLFLCCIAIALAIVGGLVWALIRLVQRGARKRRAARNGFGGGEAKGGYSENGRFGALRRRTSGTFGTLLRASTLRLVRFVELLPIASRADRDLSSSSSSRGTRCSSSPFSSGPSARLM